MRSLMQTVDMSVRGEILRQLVDLIDTDKIRTTLSEKMDTINATNLKRAHQLLESGKARGKIGLEGFNHRSQLDDTAGSSGIVGSFS